EESHAAERGDAEVAVVLLPLLVHGHGLRELFVVVFLLVADDPRPAACLELLGSEPTQTAFGRRGAGCGLFGREPGFFARAGPIHRRGRRARLRWKQGEEEVEQHATTAESRCIVAIRATSARAGRSGAVEDPVAAEVAGRDHDHGGTGCVSSLHCTGRVLIRGASPGDKSSPAPSPNMIALYLTTDPVY